MKRSALTLLLIVTAGLMASEPSVSDPKLITLDAKIDNAAQIHGLQLSLFGKDLPAEGRAYLNGRIAAFRDVQQMIRDLNAQTPTPSEDVTSKLTDAVGAYAP